MPFDGRHRDRAHDSVVDWTSRGVFGKRLRRVIGPPVMHETISRIANGRPWSGRRHRGSTAAHLHPFFIAPTGIAPRGVSIPQGDISFKRMSSLFRLYAFNGCIAYGSRQ